MPGEDQAKRLEMRISRLEEKIDQLVARRPPVDLSADELAAYQKVRDVLAADWGDFCGINDCFRCIVVRCGSRGRLCDIVCKPCDVECSCGPCSYGGLAGGMQRFGSLGQ